MTSIIADSCREVKRAPAGLYVLPYAVYALRQGTITSRQAILLAHVDRSYNPYSKRHGESEHDAQEAWPVEFHTGHLRRILRASQDTVLSTITGLRNHRPRLLHSRRLSRYWWRLWTTDRTPKENAGDSLYVPPPILDAFECGELTPVEMFLVGKVASFTRRSQLCYASNVWFGRLLGIEARQVRRIIQQLARKGWLKVRLLSNDELGEVLDRQGRKKLHRCGGTCRLLSPPELPWLHPKFVRESADGDDENVDSW